MSLHNLFLLCLNSIFSLRLVNSPLLQSELSPLLVPCSKLMYKQVFIWPSITEEIRSPFDFTKKTGWASIFKKSTEFSIKVCSFLGRINLWISKWLILDCRLNLIQSLLRQARVTELRMFTTKTECDISITQPFNLISRNLCLENHEHGYESQGYDGDGARL